MPRFLAVLLAHMDSCENAHEVHASLRAPGGRHLLDAFLSCTVEQEAEGPSLALLPPTNEWIEKNGKSKNELKR